MKTKFAIIGGGIAGLCTAIRLAELDEEAILIERGSYPTHKICGEFLSPECIDLLEGWNIHPVAISQVVIRTSTDRLVFPFPFPAGGMSHVQLDPALAKYALASGVKIKTNVSVDSFKQKKHPNDVHQIHLSNNEIIEASNVIIAAGRFADYSNHIPLMRYMGFKSHFDNRSLDAARLEMFSFPSAYLGISPIEDRKVNVACLADIKLIKDTEPKKFIQNLISQNPYLNSLLLPEKNLFDQWMHAPLPDFGIKQTPDWIDAYFIGDAAITIPPACGNGLSMAIFGGKLAAEYAVQRQVKEFKVMWTKRCSSQLFWAKMLHKLMLNPSYSNQAINLSNYFPFIAKKIFELTRQSF